ncbi:MAG: alpha/beta hydrolase, partial [Tepidisphaeraceae bacterium]
DSAGAAAFADAVNQHLAVSTNRQVNVYIHGFRTNFTWEVEMMSKLFHCSGRSGAMVCFAWPARQNLLLYGSDVRRGRASAHHLADLIEQLAKHTQAERINVLSYSAGAAVASEALAQLRDRYPDDDPKMLSQRLRIGSVIYAASDIDLNTFARTQLAKVQDLSQNVVIYIARNDSALGFANLFAGASRLGRPNLAELQITREELEDAAKDTRLQVIDVSDVPGLRSAGGGMRGHGYWYGSDWVMTDLLANFRWQVPAADRGLYRNAGEAHWRFPKNYPPKVTDAVVRLGVPQQAGGNQCAALDPAFARDERIPEGASMSTGRTPGRAVAETGDR